MYASWFEYNLTKPYPFRWFTPVTIVGGIILTILLSFLNLSTSGYYMHTEYTNDPNTTVQLANSAWFMKKPFNWGDSFRATCEPLVVPVGSQFFTTNLGLRYSIAGVWRYDSNTQLTTQFPSMSYLNNTLRDCHMDGVRIDLRKADGSQPPSYWWSWDDSTSTAYATCTLDTAEGPTNISFTTEFSTGYTDFSYLIQSNYSTHGSLWWGSRLLNLYWYGTLVTSAHVRTRDEPPSSEYYVKGMLEYVSAGTDVKNDDTYFNLYYYFLQSGGTLYNQDNYPKTQYYNNPNNTFSESMTEGLQYAKMFRSLLAIDLGNSDMPDNLLLNDDLLQYAIYSPDDSNRHFNSLGQRGPLNFTKGEVRDWFNYNGINWPGTSLDPNNRTALNESYPLFKDIVGPLETKPATIYAQYACSFPTRKTTGTLLLAVLLADLVFLQALWKIYTWSAQGIVNRVDPDSRTCAGCVVGKYNQFGLEPYSNKFGSPNGSDSEVRLVS